MKEVGYLLGLDLGQSNDQSAAALIRCQEEHTPYTYAENPRAYVMGHTKDPVRHYQLVSLKRWVQGTPYTSVVTEVRQAMNAPAVRGKCGLVIDRTGVGRAVYDLFFASGVQPVGITITGGDAVGGDWRSGFTVPKKDLAGVLQATLGTNRLEIAPELEEAHALRGELQNFEVRVNLATGHASYAADWRSGTHDDLVLALACALWFGERYAVQEPEPVPYTNAIRAGRI